MINCPRYIVSKVVGSKSLVCPSRGIKRLATVVKGIPERKVTINYILSEKLEAWISPKEIVMDKGCFSK